MSLASLSPTKCIDPWPVCTGPVCTGPVCTGPVCTGPNGRALLRCCRRALCGYIVVASWLCSGVALGEDEITSQTALGQAVQRSLTLLQVASAGSAEQRTCFTCHSQAHPVLTLVEAKRRGFRIDETNLERQVRHTAQHLKRGRKDYLEGRGQGGQSDTAGYALWTLQSAGFRDSEVTNPVAAWLLEQQQDSGHWRRSSDRPPSESSHFTATYVALRGIDRFAPAAHQGRVDERIHRARDWLIDAVAHDTEDRVFRLLALHWVDAPKVAIATATDELLATQQCDGGWGQNGSMSSDAYATGTVLFALHQTQSLEGNDHAYHRGLRYLLETQHRDGSWHVSSRSRPFQAYYETGFPHGKDQFISTSATAWATLAILFALPETAADPHSDK